jgi:uncharacterized protein (TIGR03086 family)
MTTIERDMFIKASPDDVFGELTEPDRLRRWQAVSARVDLRAGGEWRFTITPSNTACGTFTEVEPGRLLSYTWGWVGSDVVPPESSTVTVELEPEGDGTRLRFRHEGLADAEQVEMHGQGWDHYLGRLELSVTGGDPGLDEWAMGGDDLDPISAAGASWALTRRVMANFGPDVRDKPTPCDDFTVHELVEHLVGSLRFLGGAAGAGDDDLPNSSAEAYVAGAVQVALEAWQQRGLDGMVSLGDNEMPAAGAASILAIELFVHGWDMAQATGQLFEPSESLLAFMDATLQEVVPGARGTHGFGDEKQSDGTPIEQLMAYTGR